MAAGLAYAGQAHDSVKVAAVALAVVIGLAGAALAVLRFEAFLLALFAVRPVLDSFKNGGTSNLAPSTAVGLVFLLAGSLWLVARHRAGRLHRPAGTSVAMVALTVAGFLSVFASREPANSLGAALKLASGLLMFLVLEQVVLDDTRRLRPLYVATCVVTIVSSVVAIGGSALHVATIDGRARGLFVHENDLAQFTVTVALLMLALRPHLHGALRRLTTVALVLAVPALYLTYTRSAWIGFVLGVLVIGILQDRRVAVGVLVAVAAAVIFVPGVGNRFSDLSHPQVQGAGDPNSLVFREQYWKEIAGFANSTPVLGIGLSMVERSTPLALPPHNTPLQIWLETGAVGSAAFLWVAGGITRDLRRSARGLPPGLSRGWAVGACGATVAFGVQMLSDNLLLQALQLWYLALAVAPALALRRVSLRA
ncbi:MAG: O-antigen ligase family protein, partial [Mycobacteriales bacterium]